MKRLKKMLALLLAMAMVLGLSATALADVPKEDDHEMITVNGVKTGATVKAYKIAEGNWKKDYGFTGYTAIKIENANKTESVTIADLANPTAEEITKIANMVDRNEGTLVPEVTDAEGKGTGVYKADLVVGMYLILVTENPVGDATVYNPMVASVYYSVKGTGDNNAAIGGEVSAENDFEVKGQEIYAKSMNPTIEKKIVNPGTSGNDYGNDVAINDSIQFEVSTQFPAYSDAYTKVEFNIIDTLSEGLTFAADPVTDITVGTGTATKGTDYTVTVDGQVMTIRFTSSYILAHKGETVVAHYSASLNKKAGLNFDKNTNTVKAEYSNLPTTDSKGTTEEKRTYHYTFGIDASINGVADEITKELLKTGEEFVTGSTTEKAPLNGATFTLTEATRDSENKLVPVTGGSVYTTISGIGEVGRDVDADGNALDGKNVLDKKYAGYLKFTGLDAGEYILQETKAPEGYSLNPVQIPVKIEAEYNTDGTLKSYTITVDGTVIEKGTETDTVKTSTYEVEYEKDPATGEASIKPDHKPNPNSDTQKVPNTKIIQLPSTGGIGTTIFTIGGCAIMIIAAGLYFASRRKKVK